MDHFPTMITIIPVIGAKKEVWLEMKSSPTLSELRVVVEPYLDGQGLERVRVLDCETYKDMFVGDDSGGGIRNVRATEIYRNNWLTHNPGTDPESLPAIAGPAVLFHRRVWT
nr:hypothetical protein [Mesorhizobium sp. NBSH29]